MPGYQDLEHHYKPHRVDIYSVIKMAVYRRTFPQEGLGVGLGCYTKRTYKKTVGVVWYSFSPIFVLDYLLLVYAHFIDFYKWRAFCSKKYKK